MHRKIIEKSDVGLRLDIFLTTCSPGHGSRKSAYKAVKRGEVLVNGQNSSPNYNVQEGDEISIGDDSRRVKPLNMILDVVYEDECLALIDKPAGIPVSGNFTRTVQRALAVNLQPSSLPDCLVAPRPVHRLDAPTSGLLLVAKTGAALRGLSRQFEQRRVFKRYCAVSAGALPKSCTVDAEVDGRVARTHFRVLHRVPSLNYGEMCLVECIPLTGRRHQIRQHLAGLGAPVVGDRDYGEPGKVLKGKGLFLCAVELAFEHPLRRETMNGVIELAGKFYSLLEREHRRTLRT